VQFTEPPLAEQIEAGSNVRLKAVPGIKGLNVYVTSTRFKTNDASGSV